MKHDIKKLIRLPAASSTFRSSITLLIVALILLAGTGQLARTRTPQTDTAYLSPNPVAADRLAWR